MEQIVPCKFRCTKADGTVEYFEPDFSEYEQVEQLACIDDNGEEVYNGDRVILDGKYRDYIEVVPVFAKHMGYVASTAVLDKEPIQYHPLALKIFPELSKRK